MICKNCGKKIPDGMNFCRYCGTPVAEVKEDDNKSKVIIGVLIAIILMLLIAFGVLLTRKNGSGSGTITPGEDIAETTPEPGPETTPAPTPQPTPETTPEPVKEPEPEYRTGTIYISPNANPRRIRIRRTPGLNGTDTGQRLYDGDRVTVYDETSADGYIWYKIGDSRWFASNDTTFGIHFDN